jgi:hypothetical protein
MLIAARMTADKIAKHSSGAVQLIKKETRRVGEIKNILDRLGKCIFALETCSVYKFCFCWKT